MRYNPLQLHGCQNPRRGAALAMVVILMALAALMAYAMLDNATLQERSAANLAGAAQADSLAESGAALALYYLQHPRNAPTVNAVSGNIPPYWPGANGITFTGVTGSTSVTVAPSGSGGSLWSITSTGKSNSASGASLTKTVSGTAQVNYNGLTVGQPLTINTGVTLKSGMTVSSGSAASPAISSSGAVTVNGGAHLTGTVYATGITAGYTCSPAPLCNPVPTSTQIRSYSSYTWQGQSYTAPTVLGTILELSTPNAGSNPLGIINASGALSLSALSNIQGTLYVNGNLTVLGAVTITSPQSLSGGNYIATNCPALVVTGNLTMAAASSLTVNGLAYVGGNITGGLLGNININGGLITGGASGMSSYSGGLTLNYNAATIHASDLSSYPPVLTPASVKLTSWNP